MIAWRQFYNNAQISSSVLLVLNAWCVNKQTGKDNIMISERVICRGFGSR